MTKTLPLRDELDLFTARHTVLRALQDGGLSPMAITRLTTATSEVARQALMNGPTRLHLWHQNVELNVRIEHADWTSVRELLRECRARGETLVIPIVRGRMLGNDTPREQAISALHDLQITERAAQYARVAAEDLATELDRRGAHLRRVNRDLEMIAAAAAHDLRQPLQAIDMFAAALQGDALSREVGQEIRAATRRMQQMLTGLMALAQVGSASTEISQVGFAMEGVLKDLGAAVQEVDGAVTVEGDAAVSMAEAHLRLVLQNLVSNALKYHRDGVPPRVAVRIARERDGVQIDVEDNGRGLPADDPRVFELFNRLGRDADRGGAGVGLALVARVLDAYGGTSSISVGPDGVGTRFRVRLPDPVPGGALSEAP